MGQVKTERDAGICQPLGAREQGFLHGGGFGHVCLGKLRINGQLKFMDLCVRGENAECGGKEVRGERDRPETK